MKELCILVIEDDPLVRKALYDHLRSQGHDIQARDCLAEAADLLTSFEPDLILSDMRLPDGDGLKFIGKQRESFPATEMVVMTAFADVETAVEAIKCGAFDYLPKPFEIEQVDKIVRNVADKLSLSRQVSSLSELQVKQCGDVVQFGEMIGSAGLADIFERAGLIADAQATTALIMGESGTGKGMIARAIHQASPRRNKPFVDINCAAIPEQLIESELFGYEKGAFTDAKNKKIGLFEAAEGGTIFLDEIGDMDLKLQAKILKILEDKEFRRLGGSRSTKVDVRIVAATNRNLKERVEEGLFREDLYYRLSILPIVMPPLRDHKENIEPLSLYFLKQLCGQMGKNVEGFTPAARDALCSYSWPGNVRELRNVVERSLILTRGNIVDTPALGLPGGLSPHALSTPDTGAGAPSADNGISPMSLSECERKLIEVVLKSVGGNKNKAADVLQIHRTTLYKKMAEYGIS
ncbi:MAG: sigma-54-dependent Fis family transcriptional regulator [Spartobacteria bacterium]|nr:sigma-54-dependent Fis family transcriptional regulator [Spartobacteria bacterium]